MENSEKTTKIPKSADRIILYFEKVQIEHNCQG